MADGEALSALFLHGGDDPAEQRQLPFRIGAAVRVRLVRHGEVGEDALCPQSRQVTGGADVRRAGVEVLSVHQIAQPGHAGVHLDVYRQLPAVAHGLAAVLQRLGLTGDGLCDVQVDEPSHLLAGGVPQNEDGHGDAAGAQLRRLVDAGHSQIVRAQLL